MDAFLQDLRYAVRICLRTPGFTTVAVLALALGIGANTAIFTIVNTVLIERLPFKDPAHLVVLWEENARRPGRSNVVGPMNFVRWQERATSFDGMAGFVDTRANLTGSGIPEELTVQNVTAGFFSILGVAPMIGRSFTDAESADRDSAVVLLSYALWQRRFGGDPSIVGKGVQLNGRTNTVVGVLPPDLRFLMKSNSLVGKPIDLWAPWILPANARDARGRYMDEQLSRSLTRRRFGVTLLTLFGAVAVMLAAIGLYGVLAFLVSQRRREIGVRIALGATAQDVMQDVLGEGLRLAGIGMVLGLALAVAASRLMASMLYATSPMI